MLRSIFTVHAILVLFLSGCNSGQDSSRTQEGAQSSIWDNSPYESTSVAMEIKQVSDRSYYVQGPPGTPTDNDGFVTNAGFVITDEGVVVLDALGTPSLAWLLLSKIREVTDRPIAKVIVTHYHADHIYGLQVFKDQGAEIIAPAGSREYVGSEGAKFRLKERRDTLFPWVDENTYIVEPDSYVSEKTSFKMGGIDFVLDPIGSTHSQGDLTMHVVQENVLYAGDLIFEGRIPFVAGSSPTRWINSLSKLDATKFKVIVPGHGAVSSNPAEAIGFTLNYLNFLHTNLSDAVDNLVPFDEAYKAMDWSAYKDMPAARANRMNAYFVYLELEASSIGE